MRNAVLLLMLVIAFGCSEAGDVLAARTDEARSVGLAFVGALGAGDVAKATGLAGAPMKWRSSRAERDEDVARLVAAFTPRVAHIAKRWTAAEAFSRGDLEAGRWPRGRTLEGDAAAREADALGVGIGGYLVRVHGEADAGCLVALNPVGTELRVTAVNDL